MSVQDDSLCCLPSGRSLSARARERDAEPSAGGSQDSGRHYKVMRSCDIDHTHTLFKKHLSASRQLLAPDGDAGDARGPPHICAPCVRTSDRTHDATRQSRVGVACRDTSRIRMTAHPHGTPAHDATARTTPSRLRSCVQPRACRLLQGPGGDTRSKNRAEPSCVERRPRQTAAGRREIEPRCENRERAEKHPRERKGGRSAGDGVLTPQ